MQPWAMIHLELCDPGAAFISNSGNKAMHLAVEFQAFGNIAAHRFECAAVVVQFNLCRPGDEAIGNQRGQTPMQKRISTVEAPTADEIVAFFQFRQQRWNILGIVLCVTVHKHDHVTAGIRETRRNGGGLTKITLEPDHPETGLLLVQTSELGKRSIAAPVVDHHDFVGLS